MSEKIPSKKNIGDSFDVKNHNLWAEFFPIKKKITKNEYRYQYCKM